MGKKVDSVYELVRYYQTLSEANKIHVLATVKMLSAVQAKEEFMKNEAISGGTKQ